MRRRVLLLCGAAAAGLRCLLFWSRLETFLMARPELATPASSFRRLLEGLALAEAGLSPYAGGACHEVPLLLWLAARVLAWGGKTALHAVYVAADVWSALCLGFAAQEAVAAAHRLRDWRKSQGWKEEEAIKPQDPIRARTLVTLAYLFNPFSVMSCVTASSSVIQNALIASVFYYMMKKKFWRCALALALAAHQGLYSALLAIPAALAMAQEVSASRGLRSHWPTAFALAAAFVGLEAFLLGASVQLAGTEFLSAVYGFMFTVPDLTPNVGLFWYFFTEMFEHFRTFFLYVFQLNIFVYVIPLAITLRQWPAFLALEYVMLVGIFKPYPTVGDAAVFLSLLPAWSHLYGAVRHGLLAACALVVSAVLGPVMWLLWIHSGSANANFYFAVTLTYSAALIFLVTDLLYSQQKHQLAARFGRKPKVLGKEAKVLLELNT